MSIFAHLDELKIEMEIRRRMVEEAKAELMCQDPNYWRGLLDGYSRGGKVVQLLRSIFIFDPTIEAVKELLGER